MAAGMRVGGGGSDPICAVLTGHNGRALGEVLDVSLKGAAVRFPRAQSASYFIGEQVQDPEFRAGTRLRGARACANVGFR